ncbi:hypothetical protein SFHH103_psfHH103d_607 (plasmid) [Sinorhizobium fredii HH103]|nr:hypothetical protein SFHH103_04655 [Sinorhizobium fredii HH103]CEO91814.1 hypothetical protein SFHH103_psfHH103d_607 [Sinorhizobium fredii HH103]
MANALRKVNFQKGLRALSAINAPSKHYNILVGHVV